MLKKLMRPSQCLLVQPAVSRCRYLVVQRGDPRPTIVASGCCDLSADVPLAQTLEEELADRKLAATQVLLVCSRAELEVNTLRLPPAAKDELPELVAHQVAQQTEEDSQSLVSDFVLRRPAADDSSEVLSFSIGGQLLDLWKQQFRQQKRSLSGVTFRGLGPVYLLNRVTTKPALTSLVVSTCDEDIDLAVVESGRPVLLRTIPRASEEGHSLVEQLAYEIQRTLTLEGHPEEESTRLYLMGTVEQHGQTARLLSEKLTLSVSVVNPLDQVTGDTQPVSPSCFASLIGLACAWNQHALDIDLLNPRRPQKAAVVGPRLAVWGMLAASILAFCGFLVWEKTGAAQRELEQQQARLQRLIKPVRRSQTTVNLVDAVSSWRASDISWLDELRTLSEKLPPADEATVKTLTMTTTSPQRGRIDLSVEVSDPKVRMDLEEAIRDPQHAITSKRVTDASRQTASAWQFQTTIMVLATPPPSAAPGDEGTTQTGDEVTP